MTSDEATATVWDIAVIGAGMGGATLAAALAADGRRVLVIEKGHGSFPDTGGELALDSEDPEERLRNGCWPTPISGRTDGTLARFYAPLGCGAGGSTLLYAAALERFEPSDFASTAEAEHFSCGWPVDYAAMLPWYRRAEALYRVRGSADPLRPDAASRWLDPPPLADCDRHFHESFRAAGLHPYRLHVGYGYQPGCVECGGYLCTRGCKADAKSACLDPALRSGRVQLLERCEVERLDADGAAVRGIVCRRDGAEFTVRARLVALSAGALFSPVLLLKSANGHWPRGLGNASDLVGRNLMFHSSDLIALWPRGRHAMEGARKTLAFRDFYVHGGQRLGSIQSTGLTAGYGNVVHFLKNEFDRSPWRRLLWPLRPFVRVPAYAAAKLFGRASIFATILEDRPYPENRVLLDAGEPSGMRFEYTVHAELRERTRLMRRLYRQAFARHHLLVLSPEASLNHGHPCGTCRFGTDPAASVLDADCRVHGVDNLYVVDASFMPSSGGANPSLTIAANALRVAAAINARTAASPAAAP
jgi:choline dehydrogenase-like flavoprotein